MLKINRLARAEDAVSAVIGVILMVAITVILAAVIAAFVFGMAEGAQGKKTPAFTIKRIVDHIDITFVDYGGANTITNLELTTAPSGATFTPQLSPVIGGTYTISNIHVDNAYIVMTAIVDGKQRAVLAQTV